MHGLQRAFDRAHPAVQVMHHVLKVEIADVGALIGAIGGTLKNGVYAFEGQSWTGSLRMDVGGDAGVLGRRGDEDEEGNSDEDSDDE
jgi:hypothetical protein